MTTTVAITTTDALLRLMNQRINDLEQEMTALKKKLADEQLQRQRLVQRYDRDTF